jgi:hypothetical protein
LILRLLLLLLLLVAPLAAPTAQAASLEIRRQGGGSLDLTVGEVVLYDIVFVGGLDVVDFELLFDGVPAVAALAVLPGPRGPLETLSNRDDNQLLFGGSSLVTQTDPLIGTFSLTGVAPGEVLVSLLPGFLFAFFDPDEPDEPIDVPPGFSSQTINVLSVPEPALVLLLGVSLAGLGIARRGAARGE